ncbi:ABC transporter substrate-binding protein [Phototrophicus methaneseepsis]|uniref:ABC transporter substrate-binding protein n=1 Tax=Phototrophicus methaneseepsis TaxID=2710758 RepID=A0A7S8ECY0_9CHLR|nr:ABC transporter substrate-binding protein [Phototrophicus methaneseepsis]QPC84677.1 ABC transporter substrate-binding protein [Phototrophicus methaneseepsis]
MSKKLIGFFLLLLILVPSIVSVAQEPQGLPVDLPREELFIVDQIFRYGVPGNYNIWTSAGVTPHRHSMMNETLWYRDQETGERINGLAASDPVYNEDYTQMSVDLRENLTWSDGVPFTADDVVYTVETLMATPELGQSGWNTSFNTFVASVEKTGDYSVQFNLNEPNSRFHTLFETVWNGVYIMPKHIFETVDDMATFTFENPVVLGTYIPIDYDPNGFWELYERREDWQNSPAGVITENAGPRYILTIFYGDSARKAIAMSRGELDVYFDADFEAFQTTLETTPTARSWYAEFPWAYPNENNTRQFTFNYEGQPLFQDVRVRWALALSLNIVELQTEYIGGVAKVTALPIPPTQALQPLFHDPLEEWLVNLQIDLGDGTMYNPYDPTIPDQIAAWAEEQGYTVPGTPREVFGTGWWKYDTEAAATLLESAGFTRADNGDWMTPDGEPFTLEIQSPPDENDAFRMANAATDMWSDFGIDVTLSGLERNAWDQNGQVGQFEIDTPWMTATNVDGDAWPQLRGWHPEFYIPVGQNVLEGGGVQYIQRMRLQDPQWGEYIDAMIPLEPGSEESLVAEREFFQYITENMQMITTISFKKFVTWDERYWTGFPTAENPSYMPLYWFHGGKFAIQSLMPAA